MIGQSSPDLKMSMLKLVQVSILCTFVVSTFGQFEPSVPVAANAIAADLNAKFFPGAAIILVNEGLESDLEISKIPYQKIQLNKGFTMERFTNCSLKLQDPKGLIPYAFLSTDNPLGYGKVHDFFSDLYREQKPSLLELLVPLYKLSHKKGKRSHLLSKNPKKAGSGKWAVQLKAKGGLPVRLIATDDDGRIEKIDGHILTFVFDNEELARRFDSQFRQIIRLCSTFDPGTPGLPKRPPIIIVN